MFFHLQLDKDIEVEPRFFGPRLQEILKQKVTSEVSPFSVLDVLLARGCAITPVIDSSSMAAGIVTLGQHCRCLQVEGTCSSVYGFMLMVTDIGSIGKGKIREGTGSAVFHVQYTCLVFRPFKGEVLDAVVTSVNKARRALFATLSAYLSVTSVTVAHLCRWASSLTLGRYKYLFPNI